ncbi:protein ORF125 [Cyprinid herpesvirus 3]|uniref:ORF125R n=1 Tax=Cyprinid herpesvirus 3 TaxID=180230 RepID=A3QTT4_CYHV3|nr:unnamed protein product [Cyprinid herpesvirus 3]ABG42952.1 protein ORF125 [Cyprinid herpesvirus 3]AIC32480.1 ORF125R [Cyprinid herpesvirus 3]AJP55612.1 protein ORF125 [Cyprinid herpesvirus 3]AJP55767.1 protein ORF125 [Cyprinid herpesvirus 3]AOO32529.1 protein ORF125 [Cyprinid herpesvirus 3]
MIQILAVVVLGLTVCLNIIWGVQKLLRTTDEIARAHVEAAKQRLRQQQQQQQRKKRAARLRNPTDDEYALRNPCAMETEESPERGTEREERGTEERGVVTDEDLGEGASTYINTLETRYPEDGDDMSVPPIPDDLMEDIERQKRMIEEREATEATGAAVQTKRRGRPKGSKITQKSAASTCGCGNKSC